MDGYVVKINYRQAGGSGWGWRGVARGREQTFVIGPNFDLISGSRSQGKSNLGDSNLFSFGEVGVGELSSRRQGKKGHSLIVLIEPSFYTRFYILYATCARGKRRIRSDGSRQ